MRQQLLDREKTGGKCLYYLIFMVLAYIVTAALLLGLAFLLYKFHLNEKVINISVIVIYVLVTFLDGFVAGKKMKVRKFLWGFLLGSGYFLILAVISHFAGTAKTVVGPNLFTTFALCAGGGMLGGMLS